MTSCCSNQEETFSAILHEITNNATLFSALFVTFLALLLFLFCEKSKAKRNGQSEKPENESEHKKLD